MDLLQLALIGAAVSLIVQFVKSNSKLNPKFVALGLALVGGVAYYFVKDNQNLLVAASAILGFANAVYVVLISYFE